jgi:hypothetical protein
MPDSRPRVAVVATEWRHNSHTDVMVPKLLAGYDLDGVPVRPGVDVVSLYMDQFPDNDLSRRWAARFHVPIFPTVRQALTAGGSDLAVDAVLIIGEHGEYPWNDLGQHLYPRRELFEQTLAAIEESGRRRGRPVAVFNDKHLSYSWDNASWMYGAARLLELPFMAGSSLPVTFRDPELGFALDTPMDEALVISHGPAESYGFHALETLQCMVERRSGGETGVAAVELLHGESFWAAWNADRFPLDLYEAALATLPHPEATLADYYAGRETRPAGHPGPQAPLAFLVEYRDGLRATLLNLSGYVDDFAFAARADDRTVATAFRLEPQPPRWHFNFLVHHIERFFQTGQGPYPLERTLLTTGALAALMESGGAGARLETPHLDLRYRAPEREASRARGISLPPEQVWGFRPEDV